jgi:hypothetical protein
MADSFDPHNKLCYNPDTGKLTWRGKPLRFGKISKRFAGKEAGNKMKPAGYVQVQVDGVNYRAHRLIWYMQTGSWPKGDIDHINGVRDDNRWENLRDVDRMTNLRNMRQRINPVSGVSKGGRSSNWRAYIQIEGKYVHLGVFDCYCEAVKARKKAEKHYGFHENHGRFVP